MSLRLVSGQERPIACHVKLSAPAYKNLVSIVMQSHLVNAPEIAGHIRGLKPSQIPFRIFFKAQCWIRPYSGESTSSRPI